MRPIFLYMTMSLDGFVAGPNNELDWMATGADLELTQDNVALIGSADDGIMGYPVAVGMIPYWASVTHNPAASQEEHDLAEAINRIHGIVISRREEKPDWPNAELLVAKNDDELVEAITKLKQRPGRAIGIPGGVRTAQTFSRLGLVDNYELLVHPITLGHGKRLFTTKVNLELIGSKSYKSGVMRLRYRPR